MFLKFTALAYIDLLKSRPTPNEINRVKMIGKNRFTFSVVSSIMTAKLNDNREYPASTDAAPIIAYVAGYTSA